MRGKVGTVTQVRDVSAAAGNGAAARPDGPAYGRSGLYLALARALAFPTPEVHHSALDGAFRGQLGESLAALPFRLAAGAHRDWRPAADYDTFQSEYIRLFEVGPRGHALCPLYSGHYGRDRLRTMEELVRFYNYFGLRITPGMMPDHVTVELEFMHFLAHEEAQALESGGDVESFRLAQRDFLDRHLKTWWPLTIAAARRHRPQRFYRSLMALTQRFLDADRRYLASALRGS